MSAVLNRSRYTELEGVSRKNIDFAKMLQLTGVRHSAAYFVMRERQHAEQHVITINSKSNGTGGPAACAKVNSTHRFKKVEVWIFTF